MTTAFPLHRYTYQDYVWLEAESSTRHEYLEGEIVAMAGGTPKHAAMAAEVIGQLGAQLRAGRCRVFTSDLGVRIIATGLATYPDASVVCGPTERDPDKETNVTNPIVVVEVTSDSTEAYDRGSKLEHYKQIPSLRAAVVVSHTAQRVEVWARAGGGEWKMTESGPRQRAEIECIGCVLEVDSIYRAAEEPGA